MKKFKLDKWQKDFNKNVYAGLAGGLLVLFSQLGISEAIKLYLIPDSFLIKVFGVLVLSLVLFLILALTPLLKKKLFK